MLKVKLGVILCLVVLLLVGCVPRQGVENRTPIVTGSGIRVVNGVAQLAFIDRIPVSALREFDGKKVAITGYFGTQAGDGAALIYFRDIPFQRCAFCKPNDVILTNTLAVHPADGAGLSFSGSPFTATGVLKFEQITDQFGHSYEYRIVDAVITDADLTALPAVARYHADLSRAGFIEEFDLAMSYVYVTINHVAMNIAREDLVHIDQELMNNLASVVATHNSEGHAIAGQLLRELRVLVGKIHAALDAKDWDGLLALNADGQRLYDKFFTWMTSPVL